MSDWWDLSTCGISCLGIAVRHIATVPVHEYSHVQRAFAGTTSFMAVAMQGLDMGTTPGRGSAQSGECGGLVQRLVRMFKGEHSAEALQAASSGQGLQYKYVRQPAKSCHGLCALTKMLLGHASAHTCIWLRACLGLPAFQCRKAR